MSSFFKSLLNILNTFMDTTPRQWLNYFAYIFGLNWSSWGEFYKSLVNFFTGKQTLFVYFSALFHMTLLAAMQMQFDESMVHKQKAHHLSEKRLKHDNSLGNTDEQPIEITGIYYIDSSSLSQKKTETKSSRLANLFKKSKNFGKFSHSQDPVKKRKGGSLKNKNISGASKMSWDHISVNETAHHDDSVYENLSRHVDTYNPQFQKCYEQALLNDSSLNAKVEFKLKVGKNLKITDAQVDFSGVGTYQAQDGLKKCLKNVARTISFPNADQAPVAGKQIRFFVVLDSWD